MISSLFKKFNVDFGVHIYPTQDNYDTLDTTHLNRVNLRPIQFGKIVLRELTIQNNHETPVQIIEHSATL